MNNLNILRAGSPYSAAITREQFLFYETRTVAKLLVEGLSREEIINKIVSDNSFQYPTERSVKLITNACFRRLDSLKDDTLVAAIANRSQETAKQICLYAMMKQYRLIWDFMITVIGEKYKSLDNSFGKIDVNGFFIRLKEQDSGVASWSDSTINKLKQIIVRLLVENGYLDNIKSERLNPVLISSVLENSIRKSGKMQALVAFNCLA